MIVENDVNIEDYGIRRLTPRECWRLMDFSDSDFDETIAAYLPYPIVKVVPLGRTPAILFVWESYITYIKICIRQCRTCLRI